MLNTWEQQRIVESEIPSLNLAVSANESKQILLWKACFSILHTFIALLNIAPGSSAGSLDPRLQGTCLDFMWSLGTYLSPSTQWILMKPLLNWIRYHYCQNNRLRNYRADQDRREKKRRLQIALNRCKDDGGRLHGKTK